MQNKIIGVIAPKGSGKSYNVIQHISNMPCVAIFDLAHESGYILDNAQVFTGTPRAFSESLLQPEFCSVYRPTKFNMKGDKILCPSFNDIVKVCYLRGDMTLVIEEAHLLCNAHSIPAMLLIANLVGRHRKLNIIYIAQSFSAVARPLTRNTDEFWFFRIIEPSDLDGIKDRCGTAVMEKVQSLRKLEQDPLVPGEMLKWSIYNGVQADTE